MKRFLLLTVFIIVIVCTSFSQTRSNYSTHFIGGVFEPTTNPSSEFFFDKAYTFYVWDDYEPQLYVNMNKINSNGSISNEGYSALANLDSKDTWIASCAFNKNLYVFYTHQSGDVTKIKYLYSPPDSWFLTEHELDINYQIKSDISTVAFGDNICLFFVDSDSIAKYFTIKQKSGSAHELELVSTTPEIVDNEIDDCKGSISAITIVTDQLEEKILIVTPCYFVDDGSNENALYIGTPGDFIQFDAIYSVKDHHVEHMALMQGSVEGGKKENYMIQFGYTFSGNNEGFAKFEYSIDGYNTDWEVLHNNNVYILGGKSWFLELYGKTATSRQKHVLQAYACGDGSRAAMWKSDMLHYVKKTEEVVPVSHGNDFFNLILVAEGAPPYALNGYELDDGEFDGNPPSTFEYIKSTQNSVSASTTYSLGVEANMGLGPVSAGFKASFQETHGWDTTMSSAITKSVIPPRINDDSAGVMFYYYIAPTIERQQWIMKDWDGNLITPHRNLFFFKMNSPQMLHLKYTLDHFGSDSPRAYELESYIPRDPQNIHGVSEVLHEEVSVDFAGSQPSLDITFSETHTSTNTQSIEATVGVDAEYGIFSASASITAGLEYERESTTTVENGFHLEWLLFSPKNPDDENNVRMFNPTTWIMKATDSSAYFLNADFLMPNFKNFKPWFITYSIDSIQYGNFNDPPYFIDEKNAVAEKYMFRGFPNPAHDIASFKFVLMGDAEVDVKIYNSMGNVVINKMLHLPPGENEIHNDISLLPDGIYTYVVLINNDIISGKLIIQ